MRRFPAGVWLFGVLLAAVVSMPYLIAALSAPEGWLYNGAPLLPVGIQWDYASYISRMWHGWRGQWDYHLMFTHEPHTGISLVNGFYMPLGALAALTRLSLPFVYHLARAALTLCMVLALWTFTGRFFDQGAERWLCLILATVMGGWGWMLYFVAPGLTATSSPIEFWLTDAFNFSGALYITHFVAAIILQVVVFLTCEAWARDGKGWRLIALTLALAAESIIQPYVIVLLGPLLVLLTGYHILVTHLLTWKRASLLALPLTIHAGLILYQYAAMRSDPVWTQFVAQNLTLSPLPAFYVMAYLPFILPAVAGWLSLRHTMDGRWLLPMAWVVLAALLIYAPLPTQRRYLIGLQTPLAVLAAWGWTRAILPRLRPSYRPLVTVVYIASGMIAPLLLIISNTTSAARPFKNLDVYYRPDDRRAFAWLEGDRAGFDDVVLTTFDQGRGSGGRLVVATGQRVFMGHGFETVDLDNKVAQIRQFYDPATPDDWRRDFLRRIGAVYVWYDDYAREIGSWDPAQASYLKPGFVSDIVTIYRVRLEP